MADAPLASLASLLPGAPLMSFAAGPQYVALPRGEFDWIVQDVLPVGGLLNIYGQPKRGKSYLALQMASAIGDVRQRDVLGFPIPLHGPVAYLQIDTPRSLWAERLRDLTRAGEDFENVFFADSLMVPYPFNVLGEGFGWLKQNLAAMTPPPVAVFIDTLREVHGGEENDSGHMRNVVNLLAEAVRPAALVLISHARKEYGDGSTANLMDDNRGSGYVAGRMDCIMKVTDASLLFQSRTTGESRVVIKRNEETGFFVLTDDFDRVARAILDETPLENTMGRAKLLRERFPKKSLEACRSLVRRLEKLSTLPARTRRIELQS